MKKFGIREKLASVEISGKHFLVDPVKEIMDKIKDTPSYAGIYLGANGERFVPSTYLLDYMKDKAEKHVVLDEATAWLFVCGRDLLKTSVDERGLEKKEYVLVLNEKKEVLGYGRVADSNIFFIKNYFDIGDFLRREKK